MAGFSPLGYPCPRITSSIFSTSRLVLEIICLSTMAPRSAAGIGFRVPPKPPTAVLSGETIATPRILYSCCLGYEQFYK